MKKAFQNILIFKGKLHFKKWSRKNYAVFASLGRVVHIGKLSIALTQWIGQVVNHIEEILEVAIKQKEDDSLEEFWECEEYELIPLLALSGENYCESRKVISIYKNINCR